MWLFIEPLDILLFRDSKPFAAGEGFWARSIYPPSGLPLMGALRAKMIVDSGTSFKVYQNYVNGKHGDDEKLAELANLIGRFDDFGHLELRGPFVSQIENEEVRAYFPAPLDVIKPKESETVSYLYSQDISWRLQVSRPLTANAVPNGFSPVPLWTNETGDLPDDNFLEVQGLLNYLRGLENLSIKDAQDLWGSEFQVGIEKNAQGTAEIGKIYSVEFVRLKELRKEKDSWELFAPGFLVNFRGVAEQYLKSEGFLALGGESRAARYEKIADPQIEKLNELIEGKFLSSLSRGLASSNRFKIYLAAPAIFNNGWYPDFLEAVGSELIGEKDGLKFKLISASINKPTTVSGWDVARNRPRPAVKAVPGGSVYHFELMNNERFDEEKIETIRRHFHYKILSGLGDYGQGCLEQSELKRYGKAGFGLALVGKVKEA